MTLSTVSIQNIRNIEQMTLELDSGINLFEGENGSGKTSLLEAIYILSSGRSFRTNKLSNVIKEHCDAFIIHGSKLNSAGQHIRLALHRNRNSWLALKINGSPAHRLSDLAKELPVIFIGPNSSKLLEEGPQWRRKFLDWGVFHVEHSFGQEWSSFHRVLKQRNSLLAQSSRQQTPHELHAWDLQLDQFNQSITSKRRNYLNDLMPVLAPLIKELLDISKVDIIYEQGWPKQKDYLDVLVKNRNRDTLLKRTEYGPHRADFKLYLSDCPIKDRISRGQQKLLVYALWLAQQKLLLNKLSTQTLVLLDDISAELDQEHSAKLMRILYNEGIQALLTTANYRALPLSMSSLHNVFHVKHGMVSP